MRFQVFFWVDCQPLFIILESGKCFHHFVWSIEPLFPFTSNRYESVFPSLYYESVTIGNWWMFHIRSFSLLILWGLIRIRKEQNRDVFIVLLSKDIENTFRKYFNGILQANIDFHQFSRIYFTSKHHTERKMKYFFIFIILISRSCHSYSVESFCVMLSIFLENRNILKKKYIMQRKLFVNSYESE